MKKLKNTVAFVIILTLVCSTVMPVLAAQGFSYEAEAQVLNDLGLYNGIAETSFDPDLGTALNRETGVVMLLRIFGLEADAAAITDADAILAKFSDAATISSWAKNQVAYAVENGLVQGNPDGTFAPKAALNGKAYATLILRQLGFTPDYSNASLELAEKGGLTADEALRFNSKDLIKDDLVGISFGALSATDKDGKKVIETLVEDKVLEESAAIDAGLVTPPQGQNPEEPTNLISTDTGSSHSHLSSNADLKSLSLNNIEIMPAFSRDITSYTASAGFEISDCTVTSEVYQDDARVKINNILVGNGIASDIIGLDVGSNTVTAAVYAENGTEKDYIIIINRAEEDNPEEVSSAVRTEQLSIRLFMAGILSGVLGDSNAFTIKFTIDEETTVIPVDSVCIEGSIVDLNANGISNIPFGADVTVDYNKTGLYDLTYSDTDLPVGNFSDVPVIQPY